jgi:hypothetical protein
VVKTVSLSLGGTLSYLQERMVTLLMRVINSVSADIS